MGARYSTAHMISDRGIAFTINYKKKRPRATIRVTLVVKPVARMKLTRSEKHSTPLKRHYIVMPCQSLTMRHVNKKSTILPRNNMGAQPSFQKATTSRFLNKKVPLRRAFIENSRELLIRMRY